MLILIQNSLQFKKKVEEKAVTKNQCNRIPHPVQDDQNGKRAQTSRFKDNIVYKTEQAENQEDSSAPSRKPIALEQSLEMILFW